MFPIMQDPDVAATLARHQIDDRIRDANARRIRMTARATRPYPAELPAQPQRPWWTLAFARRSIA